MRYHTNHAMITAISIVLALAVLALTLTSCAKNPASSSITTETTISHDPVISNTDEMPVKEINASKKQELNLNGGYAICDTADGGYLVAYGRMPIDIQNDEKGYQQLRLQQYDRSGQPLWGKSYKSLTDCIYAVKEIRDGFIVVTDCDYRSRGKDDLMNTSHAMMTKLNTKGDIIWSHKLINNYQLVDDVLETPNGDLITYVAYKVNTDFPDRWRVDSTDASHNVGIALYDSNGNLKTGFAADVGSYLAPVGGKQNFCKAAYVPGKGLVVGYPTCLALYDDSLKLQWKYDVPDVCTNMSDPETVPANVYFPRVASMVATTDGIAVAYNRFDEKNCRILTVSYAGQLLGQKAAEGIALGMLSSGKAVTSLSSTTVAKTQMRFLSADGTAPFHSFNITLTAQSLLPTANGFYIVYGETSLQDSYTVVTRYSDDGKVICQRCFKDRTGTTFTAFRNGTLLLWKSDRGY